MLILEASIYDFPLLAIIVCIIGMAISAKIFYSIFDVTYFGSTGCFMHIMLFFVGGSAFVWLVDKILFILIKAVGLIVLVVAILAAIAFLIYAGVTLYQKFKSGSPQKEPGKCQFCGADMNLDDDFCTACGKKREIVVDESVTEDTLPAEKDTKQPYICKKCGAEIPDGDMFCMKCGTKKEL